MFGTLQKNWNRSHLSDKDKSKFQARPTENIVKRFTKQSSQNDMPDSLDKLHFETPWQVEILPTHAEAEVLPEVWEWPPATLTQSQVLVEMPLQLFNFSRKRDDV